MKINSLLTPFLYTASVLLFSGCGESYIFRDRFNRPDASALGSNWLEESGNAGAEIYRKKIRVADGEYGALFYRSELPDSELVLKIDASFEQSFPASTQDDEWFLKARSTDPTLNADGYFCGVYDGQLLLGRVESAGTFTNLATGSVTHARGAGDQYTLTFRLSGSSLTCHLTGNNSTEEISATDSTYSPGGYYGILCDEWYNSLLLDNFRIAAP